jgi:hypothetical protein
MPRGLGKGCILEIVRQISRSRALKNKMRISLSSYFYDSEDP